jgi:hypothetical protein
MATMKNVLSRKFYGSKGTEANRETFSSKGTAVVRDKKELKRNPTMNKETLGMAKGGAVKKGAKSPAIALIIGLAKPEGKAMMMKKSGMPKGKK